MDGSSWIENSENYNSIIVRSLLNDWIPSIAHSVTFEKQIIIYAAFPGQGNPLCLI